MSYPSFIEYLLDRKCFKKLNASRCKRLVVKMSTSEIIEMGLQERNLIDGCGDVLYKELCLRLKNEKKI